MKQTNVLRQVKRKTLRELAYEELRRAILGGQFSPAQSVTITDLSRQLKLGAMPVREAVQRLASQGAFEILPTRLVRVPVYESAELDQLFQARLVLECFATEGAANNMDERSGSELRKLLTRFEKFYRGNESRLSKVEAGKLQLANSRFHFYLYKLLGNPFILKMIEHLWLRMGPLHVALLRSYSDPQRELDRVIPKHWELIKNLEAQQANEAGAIMRTMLIATRAALVKITGPNPSQLTDLKIGLNCEMPRTPEK